MTHILVYVFSGSYALGLNLNAKHCTLKVDLLDRLRERSVFKWANVQRLFYRAFTTGNYLSTVSLCIDFFILFFSFRVAALLSRLQHRQLFLRHQSPAILTI